MSTARTIALMGDTMLGRGVAERLRKVGPHRLFAPEVQEAVAAADLAVLNLECCVSDRGEPWRSPGKLFHFRAPPGAVEALTWLGVDCVTLANNHAVDFGFTALTDTVALLARAGIRAVGAGATLEQARAAAVLDARGMRIGVVGVTDHPREFAAGTTRPGVAHADLRVGVPEWLSAGVARLRRDTDAVLVTPHWGPNMITTPLRYVRRAAASLTAAGATVVAGHSAHVFHGAAGPVPFDLGDFLDDYAADPRLRNDRGLLFVVTLDASGLREVTAVPLVLDFGYTRLAEGRDWDWIRDRFTAACVSLGTPVEVAAGRLVVRQPGRRPASTASGASNTSATTPATHAR
ncbi:MAG: CapA family protein [Actinobacteria bacterium]|nr:CapA family protein [Actinomycetota bacterium]